ncbi:MAG TPA: ABC transporter substrate-binding protein [Streptosporangiaceae bacterium]|jgi:ABC-type nitrate/sulfonate/bicarbonate transport system substrate-binding protein|nr:ABC transporter substrate-binding protein [Gaiellales bacterium]
MGVSLTLGLFSTSLVARAARDHGLFAAHGLDVAEVPVASSRAQFQSLLDGEYDLVLTSPDNVLAYRLDAENPLGGTHDVRILAAVDRGLGLSLVGAPGFRTAADLRGQTVGVDVPASGFAFTLYRLLADAGLRRDADYRVESAGTTPRRREALLAEQPKFAATMLGAGHDVAAVRTGCHRIARATDLIRPYLGTVLAGFGPWIDAHGDVIDAFLAAWLAATAEVVDARRRAATVRAIGEHMHLTGADADDFHGVLVSADEGLSPDGRVDAEALAAIARLRAEYGRLGTTAPDAAGLAGSTLIDDRFLSRAT